MKPITKKPLKAASARKSIGKRLPPRKAAPLAATPVTGKIAPGMTISAPGHPLDGGKIVSAAAGAAQKPAKAPKGKPAAVAPAPEPKAAPAAASTPTRPIGKRKAIERAAAAGTLPTPPDFSADTHKPFRAKLATLVALVEARDVNGLRAVAINPTSTSPKAMLRYRDLAITALEARSA